MIITPISGESTETQVITAGRRGNRTVGDRLRLTAEVTMSASFGAPILVSGTISSIFWKGATSGGGASDPIGLEFDLRRAGSSVTTVTVDCPDTDTGSSVTLASPLSVLENDTLVLRLVAASTGTATNVSFPYFAAKVVAS